MPASIRRSSVLLGTVLLGLAAAPVPSPSAIASCAGPSIDVVGRADLRPGGRVTVTGERFLDGCQDLGSCTSVGCDDQECDYGPEPEPQEDIELRLVQGDRTWRLGTTDADETGRATWNVEIPAGARAGRAQLRIGPFAARSVRIR
jgi:hypothetical protein